LLSTRRQIRSRSALRIIGIGWWLRIPVIILRRICRRLHRRTLRVGALGNTWCLPTIGLWLAWLIRILWLRSAIQWWRLIVGRRLIRINGRWCTTVGSISRWLGHRSFNALYCLGQYLINRLGTFWGERTTLPTGTTIVGLLHGLLAIFVSRLLIAIKDITHTAIKHRPTYRHIMASRTCHIGDHWW